MPQMSPMYWVYILLFMCFALISMACLMHHYPSGLNTEKEPSKFFFPYLKLK